MTMSKIEHLAMVFCSKRDSYIELKVCEKCKDYGGNAFGAIYIKCNFESEFERLWREKKFKELQELEAKEKNRVKIEIEIEKAMLKTKKHAPFRADFIGFLEKHDLKAKWIDNDGVVNIV